MAVMIADPAVRADGKCAQCGKARKYKKGESGKAGVLSKAILKDLAADPFCSTECCRKHHKCELPKTSYTEAQAARGEEAA